MSQKSPEITWATAMGFAEGESNQAERQAEIERDMAIFDQLSDPVRQALSLIHI